MFVVLGATGHVGSAVMRSLLASGEQVIAVTSSVDKADGLRTGGAAPAVVDVGDADALRQVFRRGQRAFLLNPPAPVSTDTDREEHRTAEAIVAALDGSGLEKLVVESTYGAQAGEAIGDLSVLWDFEQALAAQPIPASVLRAAYYMSNWDPMLPAAQSGTLPSMFPADLAIPMVAPEDLGRAAARLLRAPVDNVTVRHVEGPARYSPDDVAAAFASALARAVDVTVTPRADWIAAFRRLGFSEPAAEAYARMTAVSVDGAYPMPDAPERGEVTLQDYIDALVARGHDQD